MRFTLSAFIKKMLKKVKCQVFWMLFFFFLPLFVTHYFLSSFSLNRFKVCNNARSSTFNPRLDSLVHCQICIIKLMSGYNSCYPSERVNLCDTQRGWSNKSLFIYFKMRKAEWYGAKSLNTTILFHGGYCPFPSFCACGVDLKSWLVLLIREWVRAICHLVRKGK